MEKSFQLKNKRAFFLSLIVVLTGFFSFSQTTLELEKYKAKYPGQHVIVKNHATKVSISLVKGKPQLVLTYHTEYLILDQNGILSLSEELIDFSSFEKVTINEAYVVVPKNDGSEKIKVTQIYTQDADKGGSVFHDDNKETRLIFPRLEIGALRVLDYSVSLTESRFPFGNNFCSYYPIETSTFEVVSDTSIHPVFSSYYMDKLNVTKAETIEKGKKRIFWETKNTPTFRFEDGAPEHSYFIPHILGQIGYYTTKEGQTNVVNNLQDLHKWYFTNIQEVYNEEISDELKNLSDSLTKNKPTEIEKVETIYYWVQDNIKYIAFEEGINGFVPRQPSAIIQKRYGDCKDMAALIFAMLKSVGIPSYLCWTGSRDLPYKYTEFPSSFCDNHMITLYKNDGKNYFLDATNSFLPLTGIASFTQGKQALVNLDEKTCEVVEMPIPNEHYSSMTDTTYITVSGKKISGKGHLSLDGYYNQFIHPVLFEVQKDKIDDAANSLIRKGNNSCKVQNVNVRNLTNRDKPLELLYDYTVENYVTSLDNEIYINLILDKDISTGELKKDRTVPFQFEFKTSDTYTTVLAIPEGYAIKSIPKDVNYTSNTVDFSIHYKQVKNDVYATLKLDIKTLLLQPNEFSDWNQFWTLSKNAMTQTLVLIKK